MATSFSNSARELEQMRERAEATLGLATEPGNPMARAHKRNSPRVGGCDGGPSRRGIARMRLHMLDIEGRRLRDS